ncbi:hypothetical protein Lgee_0815 [Legionella geestiana]|uniref:Uncharacterized protein n=1 Tax=Legionella geestiana TaxID=45065 RepID=A0A0W0U2H3_9GAMM|nr:hypothetical protein [Legionella geestiana]KTD01953.1 hypothetical protein Lgee_0815 [Legionella geestiana]QBS12890.1 hypothetical protein E4T54_09120 [Legionella geestiana]QDQ39419.1 hypothetical protein E3226_002900 [Legionella geestiana]STX54619.1 Uncharacterised protein [Legionella geestiana]
MTLSRLKYALTDIHLAEPTEQLEKLLPYNFNPEALDGMRILPELMMPEKMELIRHIIIKNKKPGSNTVILLDFGMVSFNL